MIFVINDNNTMIIFKDSGSFNEDFNFLNVKLNDKDYTYVVFHFDYNRDEGKISKLIFLMWIPYKTCIKNKFIYATTKEIIKKSLDGIQITIQATDKSEIDIEYIK